MGKLCKKPAICISIWKLLILRKGERQIQGNYNHCSYILKTHLRDVNLDVGEMK
jgi:hypothetical protein